MIGVYKVCCMCGFFSMGVVVMGECWLVCLVCCIGMM